MAGKYKKPHARVSVRLASWNYGWQAIYFVTVCTAHREHFFGEVVNGAMQLTELGRVAEDEWLKTPSVRPDMNLELDVFCVMPDHFHALIAIGDNVYNTGLRAMHAANLSTGRANRFGPQSKNLASIMRGYKSAVTTRARVLGLRFGWQSRFYEHVVRGRGAHRRIRAYILNNPRRWQA